MVPIPAHGARFLDRQTLDTYYLEQAEEVLRPVKRFAEQNGWNFYASHAAAQVADAERHDLIVMGTHGHSALADVILGSVGNGVLARCKLPMLLVR